MKTYGFAKGGLRVQDRYAPAANGSVIAFLPALSVVPLLQHSGQPCRAIVSSGDRVGEGRIIGRAEYADQANIHAPVPGLVIRNIFWRMPDGRSSSALVIRLEGAFEKLGKPAATYSWKNLTPDGIRLRIADKGVVEMEEPGRPIAALLDGGAVEAGLTVVVLRAVFDDPWQVADKTLLQEHPREIAEAMAIVASAARTTKAAIVVSRGDMAIAQNITRLAEPHGLVCEINAVRARYPQHNARELEDAFRKYERGKGHTAQPLVILSPSTLSAVYDAVRLNKPVMERYVAIGGSAVKRPSVLRLRLGTRIGDAIAECGGFIEDALRIVIGSPLTAFAASDLDTPITKTTSAVVALSAGQVAPESMRACIACGACRQICPVGLDPERLYKLAAKERYKAAAAEGATACHVCACCALVCPSRLPLSIMIKSAAEKAGRHG